MRSLLLGNQHIIQTGTLIIESKQLMFIKIQLVCPTLCPYKVNSPNSPRNPYLTITIEIL